MFVAAGAVGLTYVLICETSGNELLIAQITLRSSQFSVEDKYELSVNICLFNIWNGIIAILLDYFVHLIFKVLLQDKMEALKEELDCVDTVLSKLH